MRKYDPEVLKKYPLNPVETIGVGMMRDRMQQKLNEKRGRAFAEGDNPKIPQPTITGKKKKKKEAPKNKTLVDKAAEQTVKAGAKTVKYINRKSKEAKERRKREGVGEYKKKSATKKPVTTSTKNPEATTPKKSESLKSTPKKKKMHSIEKRNREIHGDAQIDALKKKHAEFKAKRKAGTHRKKRLTNAEKLKARTRR